MHLCNKIGTYLIRQGNEAPTPIDKSMANRTLEIFTGDVLQFGQGNTFGNGIDILHVKSGNSFKHITTYFFFTELDVYEGPRSDSNNNDDERRDQQNVNKCIRYKYSETEYKHVISISYVLTGIVKYLNVTIYLL